MNAVEWIKELKGNQPNPRLRGIKHRKPAYQRAYKHLTQKAKARKWLVTLTMDEYEKIHGTPCHYCFETFTQVKGYGLDRLDNTKGYHKDNVVSCCGPCNAIRGDKLTVEEMMVAMAAVLELRRP